ncbi:MAG: peptidoglycan-associated lipoprotein Pal [Caulobacterales bacterium]
MRSLVVTVLAAATLTACASRPEPVAPAAPIETPTPSPRTPPQAPAAVPQGPVPGSLQDFQVSVGDRVYFDYDSFGLTQQARAVLERQAAWLQRYTSARVLIAGNCDERGTREYNFALGARRAAAAKDYLVSLGVSASRVETVSYGKERPIDPSSTEQAFSVNRNAHTQIVSGAVS